GSGSADEGAVGIAGVGVVSGSGSRLPSPSRPVSPFTSPLSQSPTSMIMAADAGAGVNAMGTGVQDPLPSPAPTSLQFPLVALATPSASASASASAFGATSASDLSSLPGPGSVSVSVFGAAPPASAPASASSSSPSTARKIYKAEGTAATTATTTATITTAAAPAPGGLLSLFWGASAPPAAPPASAAPVAAKPTGETVGAGAGAGVDTDLEAAAGAVVAVECSVGLEEKEAKVEKGEKGEQGEKKEMETGEKNTEKKGGKGAGLSAFTFRPLSLSSKSEEDIRELEAAGSGDSGGPPVSPISMRTYPSDVPRGPHISASASGSAAASASSASVSLPSIAVPQALEPLFALLRGARSVDQVSSVFLRLEQCVTLCTHTSQEAGAPLSTLLRERINIQARANAEAFFSVKDWLLLLCDVLTSHSRAQALAEEQDTSVLSLSENESLGGSVGGRFRAGSFGHDLDLSALDSEDSSVNGDSDSGDHHHQGMSMGSIGSMGSGGVSMAAGTGRVRHGSSIDSTGCGGLYHPNHVGELFAAPVYSLIRKLLLLDMTLPNKGGDKRRWNELFRLSLPELQPIQERVLLDLVGAMASLDDFCDDLPTSLSLLR
ncbi:hypothetical protein B484DRAFT_284344, partial [Ochromonadaceae sp. CCMP2298]